MTKIGIIGLGSFAKRRLLPALLEVPELQLAAVCSRDSAKAQAAVPYAKVYTERKALLSDPEVEAVIICTPNHLHEEDAIAAAEANKPTLCEKPLAPTSRAAKRILDAFRSPLLVGHYLRFKPSVLKAKELLQKGALGPLREIRAHYALPVPKENWRHKKAYGGGCMQDLGIHLIDLIHFISGEEIVSVKAEAIYEEVEESVTAVGRLANGALVTFECSFQQPLRSGFEVIGEKSRIISNNSLRQTIDPVETLCHIQEDDSLHFFPLKATNPYVDELHHFAEVIANKAPSIIPGIIGLQNQLVLERTLAG